MEVSELVMAIVIISGVLISIWATVAAVLACLMGGLMLCTGDLDREVDDALGEGHYNRLFFIGAGIPALTAFVAMEAVYSFNISDNTAWIFWFCTWGYGFWCLFRQVQVIYRVRRAHSQQKALRGA